MKRPSPLSVYVSIQLGCSFKKKVRKEAPSVRQGEGKPPRSAFSNHPTSFFPPQMKRGGGKQMLRVFYFSPSEPKVRGQSSPMCLHPPRSRSLIFQHYKLRASSHLKRAENVKKGTLEGDPRVPLSLPVVPPRSRRLVF